MRFTMVFVLMVLSLSLPVGGDALDARPGQAMRDAVVESWDGLVEAQADIDMAGRLADAEEEALIDAVARGIADLARKENCSWYECGVTTPKEEYDARARRIAVAIRTALLENGLDDPNYLWGAAGLVWHESRGNPCPFGPYSRRWAIEKRLVKDKHMVRWNTDDALNVMHAMLRGKVKRRGVDSGIGQTIWPRNAKVRLPDGTLRTATPEEMVTVEGSARALAYNLQQNVQLNSKRPWAFWPGAWTPEYGEKIEWWVRRMRGPRLGPKNKVE